jgi:chromosome segregation ATPase
VKQKTKEISLRQAKGRIEALQQTVNGLLREGCELTGAVEAANEQVAVANQQMVQMNANFFNLCDKASQILAQRDTAVQAANRQRARVEEMHQTLGYQEDIHQSRIGVLHQTIADLQTEIDCLKNSIRLTLPLAQTHLNVLAATV